MVVEHFEFRGKFKEAPLEHFDPHRSIHEGVHEAHMREFEKYYKEHFKEGVELSGTDEKTWEIRDAQKTKILDVEKANHVTDLLNKGYFVDAMHEMGFTEISKDNIDHMKQREKMHRDMINEKAGIPDIAPTDVKVLKEMSKEFDGKVQDLTKADFEANNYKLTIEFLDRAPADKLIDAKVEANLSPADAKEYSASKIEYLKKGAKILLKLAAGATLAFYVYKATRKYQREHNGCWLIEVNGPGKCRINQLTCPGARSGVGCALCTGPPPGFKLCLDPCTLGLDETTTEYKYNGVSDCPTGCKGCIKNDGKCENDSCSNCSSAVVKVPSGYTIQCVDLSFYEAVGNVLEDGVNSVLNTGKNLGSSFLKILLWIALGIGILFVIVFLFNFLFRKQKINKQ
jgi:hypothetical protein